MPRVAVEDTHFRKRLDSKGRHVFHCISHPCKPRQFTFKAFQTRMNATHNLVLPAGLLEPGSPWLSSKSNLPSLKHHWVRFVADEHKEVDQSSWDRLRGTVHARWRQAKQQRKCTLIEKYRVAEDNIEQPFVPNKSTSVHLWKYCIINANKLHWKALLDQDRYDVIVDKVKKSEWTLTVQSWLTALHVAVDKKPTYRNLHDLVIDTIALHVVFPRKDLSRHTTIDAKLLKAQQDIIEDTIKYIECQCTLHQWKDHDKPMDFESFVLDYAKWKQIRSTNRKIMISQWILSLLCWIMPSENKSENQ